MLGTAWGWGPPSKCPCVDEKPTELPGSFFSLCGNSGAPGGGLSSIDGEFEWTMGLGGTGLPSQSQKATGTLNLEIKCMHPATPQSRRARCYMKEPFFFHDGKSLSVWKYSCEASDVSPAFSEPWLHNYIPSGPWED